ncbi:hypothetical protein ASPWEDRAFT_25541 [Aspergillus wentii DTO 134E9]|uniref:AMP-dependent synthetase/ligase domain-containing protein n=1 Tax=Aspergillus wentii DTO 134E9 TaxID=1073089 RepID=A0A1L9RXR9_ASPWE|nr:uncharacterized protein ASPWEDRAFT_25541 [Aspergillus wentii DTO 134E9]OJJ39740.1 hypothetical protein ASPWEDRAFT_25541 [Aspergillus wentii DTO 134E9]
MPSPVLKRFWRDLHGKRHLLNAYGTTESGVVFLALDEDSSYMDYDEGEHWQVITRCDGQAVRGRPWHVVSEDENPHAWYPDFDEDGFYCTGDIVHREGDSHFWDGKAKGGFIQVSDEHIPGKIIEYSLLKLPYTIKGVILLVLSDNGPGQFTALI